MRLSEAAAALQASLAGADCEFHGVSTDTRTLVAGNLFVALRGERHDAHELLADAWRRGAAGFIVERPVTGAEPCIVVADTRRALGDLAAAWRARFALPLVALTGSNGKTTVKEMLAAILRGAGPVLATKGNLNNDIGVPLTLFALGTQHRYAVLELGANHPGEIARLVDLVRPTVAAITLCAPAHLEGFGSIAGVARAKAEIFSRLDAGGTAVINGDDAFAADWRRAAGSARVLHFGLGPDNDVSARNIEFLPRHGTTRFELRSGDRTIAVTLALPGEHNVRNALAAAACARALGIDLAAVAAGLGQVRGVPGRLQPKPGRDGALLLDDTYNANPGSLAAAVATLMQYPGEHWLVLGDMGELGTETEELHRQAGAKARAAGVEHLVTIGPLARHAATAFGTGAESYPDVAAALPRLRQRVHQPAVLLLKASRAMRLERLVTELERQEASTC
ncbi:MAG: UDP-N-acetylmuramoyl-tripeptide--D-alanyl-D-alanine ligase [Gammaproteobacteria bacterium]|nr:UDP-N-acetylmuramoyl-tripeptide--D-alanyl-D-alanine ligase [Gammaproteobacteria bacterium]